MKMKNIFEHWKQFVKEGEERDTSKVSKVLIIDDQNRALILRRSRNSDFMPLYWDLPGGHVIEGESHEAAALRATEEETALKVQNISIIKDLGDFKFYKTSNYSGEIKLDTKENEEYEWVTKETKENFEFTPLIKELIDDIL